jgi:hypothetical protein
MVLTFDLSLSRECEIDETRRFGQRSFGVVGLSSSISGIFWEGCWFVIGCGGGRDKSRAGRTLRVDCQAGVRGAGVTVGIGDGGRLARESPVSRCRMFSNIRF